MSAVETLAHKWYKKIVVIHIDNSAFQLSARKGWSRADRLTDLLKTLFFLCVKYECVIQFVWIPTAENILADACREQAAENSLQVPRTDSRLDNEPAFLSKPSLPVGEATGRLRGGVVQESLVRVHAQLRY